MQKLEQKLRGLELENAVDTDKERLLEAKYDALMRKLNEVLEDCNPFWKSAPSELSKQVPLPYAGLHLEQGV